MGYMSHMSRNVMLQSRGGHVFPALHQTQDTTTELPPERWDMDAYYDADVDAPGCRCCITASVQGLQQPFQTPSPEARPTYDWGTSSQVHRTTKLFYVFP